MCNYVELNLNLEDVFYEQFAMPLDECESRRRLFRNKQFFREGFDQTSEDQLILDLYDGTAIRKYVSKCIFQRYKLKKI